MSKIFPKIQVELNEATNLSTKSTKIKNVGING